MSNLSLELRQHVTAFVNGDASFDDLYLWIAEFAPDLAESTDLETRKLQSKVWGLIGEYGYGQMTEDSVRRILEPYISPISIAS